MGFGAGLQDSPNGAWDGGGGANRQQGGPGADRCAFMDTGQIGTGAGNDQIPDVTSGEGHLVLLGFGVNLRWVENAGFTGQRGAVRFVW